YIAIPTRPPAENWVRPAGEKELNAAFQVFSKSCNQVEYLIDYEGSEFAYTGDIEENILSITAVHPMREDGLKEYLEKANLDWSVIERMLREKKLIELEYQDHKFYMRALSGIKRTT
ncbi:MAG: radical SAM protein, partial [Candidatus Helarchaeota archaeon]